MGDRNGGYTRMIRKGFQQGDGAEKVYIELMGSEQVIDEKRQKRADARAKRAEEARKALEEAQAQQQAEGGAEAPPAEGGEEK
jgi:large subunit ribosomal protein L17